MPTRRVLMGIAALVGAVLLVQGPVLAAANSGPEDLFERAEAMYRQLQSVDPGAVNSQAWGGVVTAYAEVSDRYPANPLASDALWRVADIHARRVESGFPEASTLEHRTYRTIARQYPASPYAPEALLRLALRAERVGGSTTEATTLYYQLTREYPGTPQSELARRRLANAGGSSTAGARSTSGTAAFSSGRMEGTEAEPVRGVESGMGGAGNAVPVASGDRAPSGSGATGDRVAEAAAFLDPANVTGVRHFSDGTHTRVVVDLDRPVTHTLGEARSPHRVFVDLVGAKLAKDIPQSVSVDGSRVKSVRMGVNRPGVVRVVFDLSDGAAYSLFTLDNPHRIVVDVPNRAISAALATARRPPAAPGESVARQLNLGVHRIVIDPGHGGSDPGAIGRSGLTEKELTLDISRRLATKLRNNDAFEVVMTRDDDRSLELEERSAYANLVEADLFVSIHVNSSNNRKLSGFETYFLDLPIDPAAAETAARENAGAESRMGDLDEMLGKIVKNDFQRESRDLAQAIQDSLVLQLSKNYQTVRDLGVKQAPFVVLVGSRMPSVLVEIAFLSHTDEEKMLDDGGFREKVAEAVHIGIKSYIERRQMPVYAE